MSAIFLLPVCLTYWPRKYTTRVDPTSIILTKFGVYMTTHCRVIAFLSADTSRDLVTLTFWPWTVVIDGGSRDQPCHQVWRPYDYSLISYKLSRFQLITTENANAATAHAPNHVTREQGVKNNYIFGIPDNRFAYSLCNFGGSTMKIIKVICENNARPCVKKRMSFCACAKSRDLLKMP